MKAQDLIGHWVHSHEEDRDGEMVFRPASFSFPRSRGRDSFELQKDALVQRGHGPGDAATVKGGTWSLSDDGKLTFFDDSGTKAARVLAVLSVAPDRLTLRDE